jgi:hypothetical protein
VADYRAHDMVLGEGGVLTARDVKDLAPASTVVQFAGAVDSASLSSVGVPVWPPVPVPARRMVHTLGVLGPKPVVELHAAGLKVGEALHRERLAGASAAEAPSRAAQRSPLVQPLTKAPPEYP